MFVNLALEMFVEFGYDVCTDSGGIDDDVGFGGGAGIGSGGFSVSISSVIISDVISIISAGQWCWPL